MKRVQPYPLQLSIGCKKTDHICLAIQADLSFHHMKKNQALHIGGQDCCLDVPLMQILVMQVLAPCCCYFPARVPGMSTLPDFGTDCQFLLLGQQVLPNARPYVPPACASLSPLFDASGCLNLP
ncbi:hypothetical protein ACH5RR_006000 [Cinchona calisaya]|uniref:Uncharacterized protein n=1 Tax=Cinchona calisaya TaxID=153742 RepID=A0ABD3AMT0_9GENT